MADALPVVQWPDQASDLPGTIKWSDLLLCASWVRALVEAIQPVEVYLAGSLSHLVGTFKKAPLEVNIHTPALIHLSVLGLLSLCSVQPTLAAAIDNVVEKGQTKFATYYSGSGCRSVQEESKTATLDTLNDGLRPQVMAHNSFLFLISFGL